MDADRLRLTGVVSHGWMVAAKFGSTFTKYSLKIPAILIGVSLD